MIFLGAPLLLWLLALLFLFRVINIFDKYLMKFPGPLVVWGIMLLFPLGAIFLVGDSSYDVSVHHSLLAHNDFRNPLIVGGGTYDLERFGGKRGSVDWSGGYTPRS